MSKPCQVIWEKFFFVFVLHCQTHISAFKVKYDIMFGRTWKVSFFFISLWVRMSVVHWPNLWSLLAFNINIRTLIVLGLKQWSHTVNSFYVAAVKILNFQLAFWAQFTFFMYSVEVCTGKNLMVRYWSRYDILQYTAIYTKCCYMLNIRLIQLEQRDLYSLEKIN